MTKDSKAQETLLMNLEILRRIPRRGATDAKTICNQLADIGIHRDIRTIQRQLKFLSENFDIECDDSTRPHSYRWLPKSRGFSVPSLSVQESLLLKLAQEQLHFLLPPNITRAMQPFFEHATKILLDNEENILARQWRNKVRVVSTNQPLLAPKIKNQVFDTISEALYLNRWLEIDYLNAKQILSKSQKIMPLGLAQQGHRLYLVCRYDGFDNERSLALNRIARAIMLNQSFTRPKEFDLTKYDKDGRFGFGEGEKITVEFCIDKTAGYHLRETPLSKDQQIIEHDGHYQIKATVIKSLMLKLWLQSFGKNVWDVKGIEIDY